MVLVALLQDKEEAQQRGSDLRYNMAISLKEAFAGKKTEIRIPGYTSDVIYVIPQAVQISQVRAHVLLVMAMVKFVLLQAFFLLNVHALPVEEKALQLKIHV